MFALCLRVKGVPMSNDKDLKDEKPIKDEDLDKVSGGTGGTGPRPTK